MANKSQVSAVVAFVLLFIVMFVCFFIGAKIIQMVHTNETNETKAIIGDSNVSLKPNTPEELQKMVQDPNISPPELGG